MQTPTRALYAKRDEWRTAHDSPAGIGGHYGRAADEMEAAIAAIQIAEKIAAQWHELYPTERAGIIAHYAARIGRDEAILAQLREG